MQLLIGCLNSSSNRISEIDPTVSNPGERNSAFFCIFFLNLTWKVIAPPALTFFYALDYVFFIGYWKALSTNDWLSIKPE